jgi:hypothetical protein
VSGKTNTVLYFSLAPTTTSTLASPGTGSAKIVGGAFSSSVCCSLLPLLPRRSATMRDGTKKSKVRVLLAQASSLPRNKLHANARERDLVQN